MERLDNMLVLAGTTVGALVFWFFLGRRIMLTLAIAIAFALGFFHGDWLLLALLLNGLILYLLIWQLFAGGWRGWIAAGLAGFFSYLGTTGIAIQYFSYWVIGEGLLFIMIFAIGICTEQTDPRRARVAGILGSVFGLTLITYVIFWSNAQPSLLTAAAVLFGMGWFYQIPGHALFEPGQGRKPRLVSGVVEAFQAAPLHIAEAIINIITLRALRKQMWVSTQMDAES